MFQTVHVYDAPYPALLVHRFTHSDKLHAVWLIIPVLQYACWLGMMHNMYVWLTPAQSCQHNHDGTKAVFTCMKDSVCQCLFGYSRLLARRFSRQ